MGLYGMEGTESLIGTFNKETFQDPTFVIFGEDISLMLQAKIDKSSCVRNRKLACGVYLSH